MSRRAPEAPLTLADLEALREGWDHEAEAAQGANERAAVPHDPSSTQSSVSSTQSSPRSSTRSSPQTATEGLMARVARSRWAPPGNVVEARHPQQAFRTVAEHR